MNNPGYLLVLGLISAGNEVPRVKHAARPRVRMASPGVDDVYSLNRIVRRHHVYKHMWSPVVGDQLRLKREASSIAKGS